MADNTLLNAGSGGNTLRTLDDGSVHWPVGVVAYATTVGTPDVLSIPVAAALADDTANPTTLLGGSCLLAYDGATWDRVRGDATDGVLVNLGSNNDVTLATLPDTAAGDLAAMVVDLAAIEVLLGTIDTDTSSMNTDLGTLAGAVAAGQMQVDIVADGAGLATDAKLDDIISDTGAIQTAVEIIDDWDESDRAKVNLIVGQAGIASGAGIVGITVPRVTLCSDDPAVALLGPRQCGKSKPGACQVRPHRSRRQDPAGPKHDVCRCQRLRRGWSVRSGWGYGCLLPGLSHAGLCQPELSRCL